MLNELAGELFWQSKYHRKSDEKGRNEHRTNISIEL